MTTTAKQAQHPLVSDGAAFKIRELRSECDRLRALNAELVAALERCLTHFERIRDQQTDPHDSPMMAQARAALKGSEEGKQ